MKLMERFLGSVVPGEWYVVLWWALWAAVFTDLYGAGWASPFFVLLGLNAWRFGKGASCRG